MTLDRAAVPEWVSERLDRRPVRWGQGLGDFDGHERTLEIFEADAREQRALLRALRPWREALDQAADGPVVIVFHTRAESRRLYREFVDRWHRRVLAGRVAEWIVEDADTDPAFEPADVEPLRLREGSLP